MSMLEKIVHYIESVRARNYRPVYQITLTYENYKDLINELEGPTVKIPVNSCLDYQNLEIAGVKIKFQIPLTNLDEFGSIESVNDDELIEEYEKCQKCG